MRGHDDLAVADVFHPPHQLQKLDLARRRQRGFRFVEDEDALPLAALFEEAQKAFTVGMGQEIRRRASHWIFLGHLVQVSGNREKAFGAEKPAMVILGSQLARNALDNWPPIFSNAHEWSTVMYPLPPPASS